jgi:carbamoyltransferase
VLGEHALWAAAAGAEPDADLVELLSHELHAVGPRLSRRAYPMPEARTAPLYRALAKAGPGVGAASLLVNLCQAVRGIVRDHVERTGLHHLAVGGAVFDNPRLCAAIADLAEVETLWVHPTPGYPSLPIGAASSLGGVAPRTLQGPLGRQYSEKQYSRALSVAGQQAARPADEADTAAAFLAEGRAVARFQGRAGFGRHGGGTRSVLVRGDDRAAVERARAALGRPAEEEPVGLWLGSRDGPAGLRHCDKVREAVRFGPVALVADDALAARCPGVVTGDGRIHLQRVDPEPDAGLHRILTAFHRRTGGSWLACFPLASATDPTVSVPGDAVRLWRRSDIAALLLGPFLVQRAEGALPAPLR